MAPGGRTLQALVTVLALGVTAAQPSVAFVNLYKSDACNYGDNSQSITLADPQPGNYTNVVFSQPTETGTQFLATQGNNVGGTLSFELDGSAMTVTATISRLSKSDDGVTQDVDAFYAVDSNKCAYLIVTSPYKPPYTSNDIFTAGSEYSTSAEQVLGPLNEYNDLANGYATAAPTPLGGSTTPAPTFAPTSAPTEVPTTNPTQKPTGRPTTSPTPAPTQYPTFQPPPPGPDAPVPLYEGPTRCGPEVAQEIFTRRLEEEQEPKAKAMTPVLERRELRQSELDLCYDICKQIFAPDDSIFIFQVYWEDNKKICGCCRECTEQIPVQRAQIFSTACPGPSNGLVISTSGPTAGVGASNGGSAPNHKSGGKKGQAVTIKMSKKGSRHISFGVRVHTPTKGAVISNFGVQVFLPPGISYSYASIKPTYLAMPMVEGDLATGRTITYNDLSVRYKRAITIKVRGMVGRGYTPTYTPLIFSAATFTPGLFGEKTCLNYAGNTTVTVSSP